MSGVFSNVKQVQGIVTARTAASGPIEDLRYDAIAFMDGLAIRMVDATPRRWYPPGLIVKAAELNSTCYITARTGAEPTLVVLEEFDPQYCGTPPTPPPEPAT